MKPMFENGLADAMNLHIYYAGAFERDTLHLYAHHNALQETQNSRAVHSNANTGLPNVT